MPALHHCFLRVGCSSCCPTNSIKALKVKCLPKVNYKLHRIYSSKAVSDIMTRQHNKAIQCHSHYFCQIIGYTCKLMQSIQDKHLSWINAREIAINCKNNKPRSWTSYTTIKLWWLRTKTKKMVERLAPIKKTHDTRHKLACADGLEVTVCE